MKEFFYILAMAFYSTSALAQATDLQTPCASTGESVAGGIVISYTIGEMAAVETLQNGNLVISEGMLQPDLGKNKDENSTVFAPGEISIFPNPTPDNLNIQINILAAGKFILTLYDAIGRKTLSDEFSYAAFTNKKYSLQHLAAGVYMLKVRFMPADGKSTRLHTYKILKTAK
ncbi:MAG: T9SS type A sorting domain-containing protein [Ferruginibacter sp.]